MNKLINYWHSILNMPKNDLVWYRQDMSDELGELKEAQKLIHRWSEVSDVVYTYTRALWSGHKDIKFPLRKGSFYLGLLYMFPKYTLRWKFFRVLGQKFDQNLKISEVSNPQKIEKLEDIARKYSLDPVKFKDEARKLMKRWIFLE